MSLQFRPSCLASCTEYGIVLTTEEKFIFCKAKPMEIIIIAVMAANRVIGRNNRIPWHIPGEQQRFRANTWGHPLIMGRRTHESIGRPLPGRRNIVISRNTAYRVPGCEVVHSLEQAYALCREEERVYNIGGEQLYRQGLDHADTLQLTVLKEDWAGDAFFPEFSPEQFSLVDREEVAGPPPYSILTYHRRMDRASSPAY
jgi:dihydrofolate reductase